MRPGSPGPHIPQCLTRAYASSSQLPLEDGQAGNAWAEGVPGQKVPKNVPFAKLLHTDKKGQLLHSATMLKGSGHQARPMGPLGGQSERMLDPGCADDYMIAAIKPSPEGQSLHNSFQELDSVLSPTTMRLRAQSSGLLHVSRMLPPGLEGEESWWLSSFSLKQRLYKGYASSVYAVSVLYWCHTFVATCSAGAPLLPSNVYVHRRCQSWQMC